MIILQSRDGTRIELPMSEEAGVKIKPALAAGWGIMRQGRPEDLVPLEGASPPAPAKAARPRTPKPLTEPGATVRKAVEDLFLPGVGLTKGKARESLQGFGVDLVDGALDWLVTQGHLVKDQKTYRVKVPA